MDSLTGREGELQQIGALLENVIATMKLNKDGLYDAADISDAIDVYTELDASSPDTLTEAKELIAEHVAFGHSAASIGLQVFNNIGDLESEEAEASGAAAKSSKQQKADEKAAKKALQAAKLEADAKKKEERRADILSSAAERADKKRQRALRKKAALDRRAARLKELAAKRAALGEKRAAAGERSALRTERWANFRARLAARSAERARRRAEKARLAAGTAPVAGTTTTTASAIGSSATEAEIWHEMCVEQNKTVAASIGAHHDNVGTTLCETCHAEGASRCAACKSIWYCSAECQAADWTHGGHPEECAAIQGKMHWSGASSHVRGRHMGRISAAIDGAFCSQ